MLDQLFPYSLQFHQERHIMENRREEKWLFFEESGNFELLIALNQHVVTKPMWWLDPIPKIVSDIHSSEGGFIIITDANRFRWAATVWITTSAGILPVY